MSEPVKWTTHTDVAGVKLHAARSGAYELSVWPSHRPCKWAWETRLVWTSQENPLIAKSGTALTPALARSAAEAALAETEEEER